MNSLLNKKIVQSNYESITMKIHSIKSVDLEFNKRSLFELRNNENGNGFSVNFNTFLGSYHRLKIFNMIKLKPLIFDVKYFKMGSELELNNFEYLRNFYVDLRGGKKELKKINFGMTLKD